MPNTEKYIYKIEEGLLISLESLQKLDPKVMYNEDYYLRTQQYEKLIKDTEQYGAQFLNDFLSYIQFHEDALKMYKRDTDEMFTNLAFAVTAQHNKEIEMALERNYGRILNVLSMQIDLR